ncbi:hypothetical protein KM043_014955 [Ampulex compressa]|nr:hypothetical protein KM043_014955 [Ampulex compressa]
MWPDLDSSSFKGGFLNDSQQEQSDGRDKKPTRASAITPVMIKHLLSVPSTDNVVLWDIPVRIVTFIGILRRIDETTTKISYDVEDETGTITTVKWLEADKNTSEPTLEVNTYVRVTGILREQQGVRHVLILRICPLENLNELTSHILEVTYVMLKAESLLKQSDTEGFDRSTTSSKATEDIGTNFGITKEQAVVYNIIQAENESESGIERSTIKSRLPPHILPRTDEILDFLVSEGHIYTTCTDDHFKTT